MKKEIKEGYNTSVTVEMEEVSAQWAKPSLLYSCLYYWPLAEKQSPNW